MLFALEATASSARQVIRDFWREFPGDPEGRAYSEQVVNGVIAERDSLDDHIVRASQNWRIARMTRVDRNVLRVGTWELLHEPETPRAVILDEAIELAKRFGTEESGAFVNGVLGRVADECGRIEAEETRPGS
jgi:N utilization substance protein B